jgi:hypothetical protein
MLPPHPNEPTPKKGAVAAVVIVDGYRGRTPQRWRANPRKKVEPTIKTRLMFDKLSYQTSPVW